MTTIHHNLYTWIKEGTKKYAFWSEGVKSQAGKLNIIDAKTYGNMMQESLKREDKHD